jgi:hypothetical protein
MKSLFSILALLTTPLIAVAQSGDSYECTMGGLVRRVVIEREGSAPVPCAVAYYKDTEAPGQRQVLWSAENEASYCSTRASEFVAKLEGWGWRCAAPNAAREAAGRDNGTN